MLDLVIRSGTVIDGTGAPGRPADVAVQDGRIAEVGPLAPEVEARETIDAAGHLVTPGFVDPHTHFDGQVTWDPLLTPSSWHGVTTVVMGNCGVGFAPAAPDGHDWLISLMEGVEDIPGSALAAGIRWGWESFPQYLDAVDAATKALDVVAQVPYGPVRAYVLRDRGGHADPTPDDVTAMAGIIREGLEAGAQGFSCAHTLILKSTGGEYVPGALADAEELIGVAEPLRELDRGVYQVVSAGVAGEDTEGWERDLLWLRDAALRTGRPIVFTLLQNPADPTAWQRALDFCDAAADDGAALYPMVHTRSPGVLLGLQNVHPFLHTPTFQALNGLDLAEKVRRMRDPATKARILQEAGAAFQDIPSVAISEAKLDHVFPLRPPLSYEQPYDVTPLAIAEREGRDPAEVFYEILLEDDGMRLCYVPFLNYVDYSYDAAGEMLRHPRSVFGLGDGGAHCGVMCDASLPSHFLTHWCRDRDHGTLPVEYAVKMMTSETAQLWGLHDRGILRPGMKADVNVFNFDALNLHMPEFWHDLPDDARRIVQRVDGYKATIISGQVVLRDGQDTGARPGALVRGDQPAPV